MATASGRHYAARRGGGAGDTSRLVSARQTACLGLSRSRVVSRRDGAPIAGADAPAFRADDQAVRSAVPVELLREPLSVLRFQRGQPLRTDPPDDRRGFGRRPDAGPRRVPRHPAGQQRGSGVRHGGLSRAIVGGAARAIQLYRHRDLPDVDGRVPSALRGGRRRRHAVPGDLRPRRIRSPASRRPQGGLRRPPARARRHGAGGHA